MDIFLLDFAFACVLMGIGIGTDVALATLARAGQLNTTRTIVYWVVGVSITHTLFPMLGYLMTYFSVQIIPVLTPLIGIVAALCIFWFLFHEISSTFVVAEQTSNEKQGNERLLMSLGLILAVSWDALWSGPAKSAQVIGWPELFVWISFLLVGMAVSLLAISSVAFSNFLAPWLKKAHKTHLSLLCMQYSVIAYFGFLALLRYTFGFTLQWQFILLIAFFSISTMMLYCSSNTKSFTR